MFIQTKEQSSSNFAGWIYVLLHSTRDYYQISSKLLRNPKDERISKMFSRSNRTTALLILIITDCIKYVLQFGGSFRQDLPHRFGCIQIGVNLEKLDIFALVFIKNKLFVREDVESKVKKQSFFKFKPNQNEPLLFYIKNHIHFG